MPSLKLTMAASVYAKPYKKIGRTITTANSNSTNPAPTTASFLTSQSSSLPLSLSLNSNKSWRTLITCARLPSNNNKKSGKSTSCYFYHYTTTNKKSTPNENLLGFTFRGSVLFISRKSSSSTTRSSRSGSLSSSSTTSGSGNDMGPEDKIDDASWYNNDRLNSRQNTTQTPSPLPSMLNHNHQQQDYSKILTLPTVLTIARVAAVPLLIATFYVDGWWGRTATTSIFIAAAVTDWLDGYLARKMRLSSAFGAFLDPVADKLMVAATLILLCSRPLEVAMFGDIPWLFTVPAIAIIGREITMSAVREWAASQSNKLVEAVAVNNLGKWKTATQMTALTILLATRDSSIGGPGILVPSGVVLLYISAGLSVWSLAVYMSKIWKVLMK